MDRNISFRRTAQKLVKEGNLEKAIEAYEEVVSSGDADPYDFVYAGDLYVKLDLLEEAVGRFSRGVSAYSRLGFNRNAIALCRRILRLDADQLAVYRELGDLYSTEELIDDALESYFVYLERTPLDGRDDEKFRETLTRAEELAPRRPEQATRLSELLVGMGHGESAAEVLSRAADIAIAAGKTDVGEELIKRAIGINPMLARGSRGEGGVEERLQELHRTKASGGSPAGARGGAPLTAEAACLDTESSGFGESSPTAEAETPLIGSEEADRATLTGAPVTPPAQAHLAGFQEVRLDAESGEQAESEGGMTQDPLHPHATSEMTGHAGAESTPTAVADWETGAPEAAATVQSATPGMDPREILADEDEEAQDDPARAAAEAIERGDWKLARRWVDAWLLRDPTAEAASDALIRIAEAIDDQKMLIEGLTLKGDLLIQEQDLATAVPLFWRVLELDPENDTAQRRMARFRELGLVVADAQPTAEEAEADMPAQDSLEGSVQVPGMQRTAMAADAKSAVERAAAEAMDPARALAVLTELRDGPKERVDPQNAQTHYERAVLHMETGRLEEALDEFEAALGSDDTTLQEVGRAWELRGKCLSALGRHREAIAAIEPIVVRLSADDLESAVALNYFLALEHETLGEADAAKERLREALQMQPGFDQAARRLSQLEERAA